MAKTLARIADEKTDDREFALHFLRQLVSKNPRDHVGTYAADALAEFGDTSAVDIFYAEWKSLIGDEGQVFKPHVAFYLCRHGRRREWELMHEISLDEVRRGKGPGWGAVWSCVVNSGVAGKNPYAIPFLALALDETENGQPSSYAGKACELFEKQVGKNFGYRRDGTADERLAAIRKARDWWDKEGQGMYTFEKIEATLVPAKATPPRLQPGK